MSELELIRSDAAYSSQKQLSVGSKHTSIFRAQVTDNEPEITLRGCTSCTVLICYNAQ